MLSLRFDRLVSYTYKPEPNLKGLCSSSTCLMHSVLGGKENSPIVEEAIKKEESRSRIKKEERRKRRKKKKMIPKIILVAGAMSGVIAMVAAIDGDPAALAPWQIIPANNATTTATTAASLATPTAAAIRESEDPLDKVYKILQISLSVVAFVVVIVAAVVAARRGEAIDWENGWPGRVMAVLMRARDGIAHLQERRAIRNLR